MRIIISDTGPILHLLEADALSLLHKAGEVLIPQAVESELSEKISKWDQIRPSWLTIGQLRDEEKRDAMLWLKSGELDIGEAEAIAMAHHRHPDWLLTDDAAARLFATVLGCDVHGSLGVILWGAVMGHVSKKDAATILKRLAESSLWISQSVLNEASRMLDGIKG